MMTRLRGSMPRSLALRSCLAIALTGSMLSGCGVQRISLPSPPPPREQSARPATASLLNDAEQALNSGDARRAEGYLERAVRIEPQNPRLWHGLAQSKFQQGQYPQAIQMSLKSNSCLPDHATEQNNWLLMEKAYRAMGEVQKAENAHAKTLLPSKGSPLQAE